MAMKKESGANKKPVAKKATATKSRGSKTAVQMGNMNQMEAIRQKGNAAFGGKKSYNPTKQMATSARGKMDQRAGGGKNLSEAEMKNKKRVMPAAPKRGKASRGR